jgi:hypothetical protein
MPQPLRRDPAPYKRLKLSLNSLSTHFIQSLCDRIADPAAGALR